MIHFQPNCTFPSHSPTGFVSGTNIRTTLDIAWSCISIIILSTWTVLHLSVPPELSELELRPSWRWVRKQSFLLSRKLSWMGMMLASPEYLISISARQLLVAYMNTEELNGLANTDDVPWSMRHTILANMGGIAICFEQQNRSPSQSNQGSLQITESRLLDQINAPQFIKDFSAKQRSLDACGEIPWKLCPQHLNHAIQAGTELGNIDKGDIAALAGTIWILDSKQLILARKNKIITKLPYIKKTEIADRAKSDNLVKFLAVLQVLWLIVQLITRRLLRLPSTPLEISTVAFSASAFILYLIEWQKPKDVGVPINVYADPVADYEHFKEILEAGPGSCLPFYTRHYYSMPNSAAHPTNKGEFGLAVFGNFAVGVFASILFGGIHLFAWNLEFPNLVEQHLWRISAIITVALPLVYIILQLPTASVLDLPDGILWKLSYFLIVAIVVAFYVAARVFLMIESFRSLYFLPADAFTSTWAANAPHLG